MHDREILHSIAKRAMLERGLRPEFSPEALAEIITATGLPCLTMVTSSPPCWTLPNRSEIVSRSSDTVAVIMAEDAAQTAAE